MDVGFDSAHGQYKFLGLYDEEAEGVGTHESWKTHEFALVHIVGGPWTTNMGIHVSLNNSSVVNFLCYKYIF
jgi:hypothetical protein